MAVSKNLACCTLLLALSLCVEFCHSFQPQILDAGARQLAERSNTSFYGGVALSVTITTAAESCPSELQTCTTGDDPTCCPSGTFCEDNGDYCCPIGVDCSSVVKLAPVCADSTWSLYEADGNGKDFFCCLPGAHGLPGSGCVQDGAAAQTVTASSITQATAAPKASSTATGETTSTATQGETTATGTSAATSGSGNGTSTAEASSTPTKSGANKMFAGTSTVILAAIFVFGFAA